LSVPVIADGISGSVESSEYDASTESTSTLQFEKPRDRDEK
jgi:hypothetical protein